MTPTPPRKANDRKRDLTGGRTSPVEASDPAEWFDRSSIALDAMVVIEDVSEEEWWRRAPEGRVCEFFDGTVYMPSPASAEHQDEVGFWLDLLNGFKFARL